MHFSQKKYSDLLVSFSKNILWITLNRPDERNAISSNMILSLIEVLEYADIDPDVRVVILTGAGASFCAGGDIKDMEEQNGMFAGEPNELRIRYRKGIQSIPETMARLSKPVIAMVNGHAVGAGCDLVAMCDLRVASQEAKFAETFSKLALVPGDGGTYYLQRAIGYTKAMEMYMTGDMYSAEEALKMNLVNKVTSKDGLKDEVEKIALKISQNSPIAIQMTKRALEHAYRSDLHSNLELLSAFQAITQRTEDHKIALKAFRDKKAPDFRNL